MKASLSQIQDSFSVSKDHFCPFIKPVLTSKIGVFNMIQTNKTWVFSKQITGSFFSWKEQPAEVKCQGILYILTASTFLQFRICSKNIYYNYPVIICLPRSCLLSREAPFKCKGSLLFSSCKQDALIRTPLFKPAFRRVLIRE